ADAAGRAAYQRIRREVFVTEQGLFARSDRDDRDDDPRTIVLVARACDGAVPDIGWWQGGRLAVSREARRAGGVGAALVRAACAQSQNHGVVRFDATVQATNEDFFTRLGWIRVRETTVAGVPHVLMRWPVDRFGALARATKAALGPLLAGMHLG